MLRGSWRVVIQGASLFENWRHLGFIVAIDYISGI